MGARDAYEAPSPGTHIPNTRYLAIKVRVIRIFEMVNNKPATDAYSVSDGLTSCDGTVSCTSERSLHFIF
jgi:hypothetical protein